jgi:plastocyanin
MKTFLAIFAVIVIVGGAAFAIKHNNDNKNNNPAPATSSHGSMDMNSNSGSSVSSSSAQPEATNKVEISNFAFSPADITVKKGTTVTWTNKDSVAHDVTENDDKDGPKSQRLEQGQTFTFTYNTAGTFKYFCSIHPNMLGSVTVTE